jgi:hypothetical protein
MENLCNTNTDPICELSIIPVGSNKQAFLPWKQYQTQIAPVSFWHQHYMDDGYVGIICGKVSGNLECIDIDIKNDPTKSINDRFIRAIPESLYYKLAVQRTPSGGLHLIYKCQDPIIEKSQKLAYSYDGDVIIETRGEGAYFCTHRKDYESSDKALDFENIQFDIPVITKEERECLLELARSLTDYFPTPTKATFEYKESAITIFNKDYDILPFIEQHGYRIVKEVDNKVFIKRPGGSSEHSGYYFKDSRTLFLFSGNASFKAQQPYNHFQILKVLEGNNDYATTLKLINKMGFPSKDNSKVFTTSIVNYLNKKGIYYNDFTQDVELSGGTLLDQRSYNTTFLDLQKELGKLVSKNKFDDILNSNYIASFNPVKEFVKEHNHICEHGTIKKWFNCLKLKNKNIDRDIALKYVTKWFVGIIAQALNGEYPNEFFLALLSTEQGIGKTTLLRYYSFPIKLQKYVVEHPLTDSEELSIMMSQSLLIIDDELDGKSWNQMNKFKSLLSKQKISLRRKYDRRISKLQRRASFAGSGNMLNVVKESSNRRIIPLELESIDHVNLEKVDLTAMFMEAYDLYTKGHQYSFQKGDNEGLQHLYQDYVQKSDLDIIVDEYVLTPYDNDDEFFITNLDLITTFNKEFGHNSKKLSNVILGKMMAERGIKSKRQGNNRVTSYMISQHSKILQLLDHNCHSWNLNTDSISDYLSKKI